jgi:polyamine oxidase
MYNILLASMAATLAVLSAESPSCSLNLGLNEDGRAPEVDVLILGAGITGVTAARTLEVNGITDFLVLEGGDRIGGRIREDDGAGLELGANWIHGLDMRDKEHHPIWREWTACDKDGPDGSVTPFDFTRVYNHSGGEYDIWDKNGTYLKRKGVFDDAYKKACKLAMILADDISLREGFTKEGWTPLTPLDNFTEWVKCDFDSAITPDEASLLLYFPPYTYYAFLGPEPNATAVDYLVTDRKGYSFVTECLARNFKKDRVKLNSVVTAIHTAEDCVCATVNGSSRYCGRYGIVTFSTGALHAAVNKAENSVRFKPPLPDWKQDAIRNATPVFYGKVHLLFNSSFWNVTKEDQQVLGYVSNKRGYYAYYIIDKLTPNVITVDVAENLAVRVSKQSEKETIGEVMTILRKMFGPEIPDPYRAVVSKWSTDPLFHCSYTAYHTGVPENVFDLLLKPVNDSLYFAGEGMNSSDYGYTHSGYGSGAYVAHQIAHLLSPSHSGGKQICGGEVVALVVTSLTALAFIFTLICILGSYVRARRTGWYTRYITW